MLAHPPPPLPRQAIKPDGVQRQLVGEVITRFEKKGYKLVAMKVCMENEGLKGRRKSAHT